MSEFLIPLLVLLIMLVFTIAAIGIALIGFAVLASLVDSVDHILFRHRLMRQDRRKILEASKALKIRIEIEEDEL